MAMLHKIGSPLTAENRVKMNENWDVIEQLISSLRYQLQFISGQDDIEAVITRLNQTMDNVTTLEQEYRTSLDYLVNERDRLLEESEANLHNQIEALARQAENQLGQEIEALQQEIVDSINRLEENIETGERLQSETSALIEQLTAGIEEMESRTSTAIEGIESRTQAALDDMESRIVAGEERTNAAIGAVDAERERIEQIRMVGEYDEATTYAVGNMVAFGGSTYAARVETTGIEPTLHESSDTWELIARRGMDGLGTVSYINNVGADEDGRVTIEKDDIGLGNVDNTPDAEKPLSGPQRAILDEMMTNLKLLGAPGDGSDARQFMIDALAMDNETILIPKGIYTMKEVPIRRNIRIVGTGWDSVLKLPTNLTSAIRGTVDGMDGLANAMFGINEPIHVTFENLTFNGDFFNQPDPYNGGGYLRIFKPSLDDERKINVTFKNCQFINNNHSAIAAYGSGRSDYIFVNVYDCYFGGGAKGTTQAAIPDKWAQGFSPVYIGTYDNVTLTIDGNKFIDDIVPDNVTTFGRVAINATVTDTSSVANSDKLSTSMFITNNVFKNLARNASAPNGLGVIDMYVNGENAVISGNKFINSQMQSIRGKVNVKNLVVTDNIIQGGLDGGIAFHPNNYASKKGNAIVANNVVIDTKGYGILFNARSSKDENYYFESVIIRGNLIKNITPVDYRNDLANGVFLTRIKNVVVDANEFSNIQFDAVTMDEVENVTISNNSCYTTTTTDGLGRGIYGRLMAGRVRLVDNTITGNANGIYIGFNTEVARRTAIIKGNHITEMKNTAGQVIYIGDFTTGTLEGNIVENMTPKEGTTTYAFYLKGGLLTSTGNVYYDGTGDQSKAIKLKTHVTTLKEMNNSWN